MSDKEATFELDFPLGGTVSIELNQFELGHICGLVRDMELSESKLDNQAAIELARKIEAALKTDTTQPSLLERVRELREWINTRAWKNLVDVMIPEIDKRFPELKDLSAGEQ